MTTSAMIEIAFGAALLVGAAVLYRRRAQEDSRHGSQGAVILLFIAAILLVHGSGLLEYRPWAQGRRASSSCSASALPPSRAGSFCCSPAAAAPRSSVMPAA